MDALAGSASARGAGHADCTAEAVPQCDVLTALALCKVVQVLSGKLLVLIAIGIVETVCGESVAGGSRLRFLEAGSADAVTVSNDRLACTAKNTQLTGAQYKLERGNERMHARMTQQVPDR